MTFLEALAPWVNTRWGIVSLYPADGRCDNPNLFTAHAINLARRLGEDPATLELSAQSFDVLSYVPDCPGLIRRWPDDGGAQSYDELIAAAAHSSNVAKAIVAYGLKHFFCYDVENPGHATPRFFFARNICFVPFVLARANGGTNLVSQALWSFGLFLSVFTFPAWSGATFTEGMVGWVGDFWRLVKMGFIDPGDTSGKLLMDAQTPAMRKLWLSGIAVRLWERAMARIYPGGRCVIYTIYMPGHPIASYQRKDWA